MLNCREASLVDFSSTKNNSHSIFTQLNLVTGRLSKPPHPNPPPLPRFINASSLVVQIKGLLSAVGRRGLTFSTKIRTHSPLHLQNYSPRNSAEHSFCQRDDIYHDCGFTAIGDLESQEALIQKVILLCNMFSFG